MNSTLDSSLISGVLAVALIAVIVTMQCKRGDSRQFNGLLYALVAVASFSVIFCFGDLLSSLLSLLGTGD